MKKSKLRKVALMPSSAFENSLDQMSDKGRAILKAIEDYKFTIDQTLRIVKNDQQLTGVITQKKKNLDHAAQDVYNIVFEIENIDITSAYNNQQQSPEQGGKELNPNPQETKPEQPVAQPSNPGQATTPEQGSPVSEAKPPVEPQKDDNEQPQDNKDEDLELDLDDLDDEETEKPNKK